MYNEVNMVYVESSNIESIGYDFVNSELYVKFLSGQMYVYFNVAEEIYNEFLVTGSKGIFFNDNVKGKYDYNKI